MVLLARGADHEATLLGQHHQRSLGRIADQFVILYHRVGAQHHGQQDRIQIGFTRAAHVADLAV